MNKKEMPYHLKCFYKDIDDVCKKYGLSISHEDSQGAFEIENYNEGYTEWLMDAHVRVDIKRLPEELSWLDDLEF